MLLVALPVSKPAALISSVIFPATPPTPEALATTTLVPVLTSAGAVVTGVSVVAVDSVVLLASGATVAGVPPPPLSPSSRIDLRMKKPTTTAMTVTTIMIVDAAGDPPVVWRGVRPV